ncbi:MULTISPECIES: imelysin family protein [unclassified Ruegeria]|uniref:imelysin family protein n=1 Tax=unclassified Ruegeria TaxID=2625375 RepID=UPI00148985E7|nr:MULTISPECIES: imelysin family protein [unclassified Ruegeria]NOD88862.1 peptidase M75 [Ruegeria sp. HKCCD4318]NOE14552.1 peptidase M75 [Ruegeria sp. HKCCD4318-2]NOG09927.1 imelysin family protein [Ruegeria sp. HKCCD4315]
MRYLPLIAALIIPVAAQAQDRAPILMDVTETHILPRFDKLPETTGALVSAALVDCTPTSPALRAAYDDAFDSWISASHLRFGPTEVDDRAFALAFWPDTKGFTAKALSQHIATEDEAVQSPEAYSETSIAGRGFFALERMLYDPKFAVQGSAEYRCDLIQAITADIDANAQAITEGWQSYAPSLTQPGDNSPYRTQDEALQELFKALSAGLEFTADTRLGRPLGTFDRPRPNRAEARRSERSLRHVELSLNALRDLAARLSFDYPEIAADLDAAFARAIENAQSIDDPALAGVADPQARFRIEALQQSIRDIRGIASTELGPTLGISAGFNSLDGD